MIASKRAASPFYSYVPLFTSKFDITLEEKVINFFIPLPVRAEILHPYSTAAMAD